jgi:Domain of unknown function (DUF4831)
MTPHATRKKMNFRSILLIPGLLLLAACAKVVVVPVTPGTKPEAEGVFYALPKTVVKVQMKIDKTMVTPAPYQKFASIFAADATPACKEYTCSEEKHKI